MAEKDSRDLEPTVEQANLEVEELTDEGLEEASGGVAADSDVIIINNCNC